MATSPSGVVLNFTFINFLSIIDFTPVPNPYDNNGSCFFVKNNTPVADTKPCTSLAFQLLDIAVTGLCKGFKLFLDTVSNLR